MPLISALLLGTAIGAAGYVLKSRRGSRGTPAEPERDPSDATPTGPSLAPAPTSIFEDLRAARFRDILNGGAGVEDEADFGTVERQLDSTILLTSGLLATSVIARAGFPVLNLLSLPGFIYLSVPFASEAYQQLVRERRVGLATIDAIFAVGMIGMGYFVTLSTFGTLYLGSRKALLRSRQRSRQRLDEFFGQQPKTVWIDVDGEEISIPFHELEAGQSIVLVAGETVPIDGTIVSGMATIDERMLTGESQPADKAPGDQILASTLVVSGSIRARVERTGPDTVTRQIADILGQTADQKSTAELQGEALADRSALPMLGLGGLTLLTLGPTGALAVMICTPGYNLKITGPVSVLNFLHLTAQNHILVKDGRAFEQLGEIDTLIFDKTGTLTEDRLKVHGIHPCGERTVDDILRYAAAAEHKQSHPLALAILEEARARGIEVPPVDESDYEVGYGLRTRVAGERVQVGSERFMTLEAIGIPESLDARRAEAREDGHSLVYVAIGQALAGVIELEAIVRPEAFEIVADLHARGITTYVVSGDREHPTRRLAARLGIQHCFYEKLPEEKSAIVDQLRAEGRTVCFIGDGINDSIALQKADVSISLSGAAGIAQDAAQILLLDGSLRELPTLLDLARAQQSNFKAGVLTSVVPAALGITGVLLLHAGVAATSALSIAGLAAGAANAMRPRLRLPARRGDPPPARAHASRDDTANGDPVDA